MFSVVVYNHNVRTIVPAQSASNVEWIEARIRRIKSGGNTALFGGVSQGAAEVPPDLILLILASIHSTLLAL